MILQGDVLDRLAELDSRSVQCCVTSPPYYGLRDYGTGEWDGGNPSCDHLAPMPGGFAASGLGNYDNGLTAEAIAAKVKARRQGCRGTCAKCGARRVDRQLGLERTPDEYVASLVTVFAEVRRVLRDDGTLWLNIGDSYAGSWSAQSHGGPPSQASTLQGNGHFGGGPKLKSLSTVQILAHPKRTHTGSIPDNASYKPKDLFGIPWLLALALRADGWYLRSDIIWSKPNPIPESVMDRPTSAYEHVFLLAKSARYFYDADAIREDVTKIGSPRHLKSGNGQRHDNHQALAGQGWDTSGRNRRNVWEIATQPYPDAHFATFPTRLVEPCILAGTSPKACGECGAPWRREAETSYEPGNRTTNGSRSLERRHETAGFPVRLERQAETTGWQPTCEHDDDSGRCAVLDPFAGSGTVGVVCRWHDRQFIGIELNPAYCQLARRRILAEGRPSSRHQPDQPIDGQLALTIEDRGRDD